MTTLALSTAYRHAVQVALTLQVPISLLLCLILDDGMSAKTAACALIGIWVGAALIMLRRPCKPRPLDLLFIRWGFLPALAAAFLLEAIRKVVLA